MCSRFGAGIGGVVRPWFLAAALLVACARDPKASCPPPFRVQSGKLCVLDKDEHITAALEIAPETHLNCRGHAILPSEAPPPDAPSYTPSVPEVGFLVAGGRGVVIQNCVIGSADARIDFGIVVLESKVEPGTQAPPNRFLANEMYVRAAGVLLLAADENQISDNAIDWSGNGVGIRVHRDADRNLASNNLLSSTGEASTPVRMFPGTDEGTDSFDVGIFTLEPYFLRLFNVVIGAQQWQYTNLEWQDTNLEVRSSDDNVYEGNVITLTGPQDGKLHAGIITAALTNATIIRGNTIAGGRPGVRSAGLRIRDQEAPAECTVSSDGGPIYCTTDADCNLFGANYGTCPLPLPTINYDGRVRETQVIDNEFIGPFGSVSEPPGQFDAAIMIGGTVNALVQGNTIEAAGSWYGVSLHSPGLESTTITQNVIHGARSGLGLRRGAATFFGVRFSRNDITGSEPGPPVAVVAPYAFESELSVDGVGNYWGHDAAPGFLSSDSSSADLVHDSFPFCVPVAALADPLPPTCP